MPLPPKAKKQTMEEVLSKSPAALKKYIAEMDEMKKQREEEERMRFKRLAEEFNAWRGSEQSRREQSRREQSHQSSREQSSKNQELMAASLTLGIPINSSMHDIKKAYHVLAMQTHPEMIRMLMLSFKQ